MPAPRLLSEPLHALGDLVLPLTCAACDRPGETWCTACRADLIWGGGRAHHPDPTPPGFPRLWASAPYAGSVRRVITAWKDEGRRDLTPAFAALIRRSWLVALAEDAALRSALAAGLVRVVPAPSSRAARRRRGDLPVRDLAVAATAGALRRFGVTVVDGSLVRSTADQSHLDAAGRWANMAGSMSFGARAGEELAGVTVVLLDDVVTTGATLAELARAARRAGAADVLALTIAATQRHTDSG